MDKTGGAAATMLESERKIDEALRWFDGDPNLRADKNEPSRLSQVAGETLAKAYRDLLASQPREFTAETIGDAHKDGLYDYRVAPEEKWHYELFPYAAVKDWLENNSEGTAFGPYQHQPTMNTTTESGGA